MQGLLLRMWLRLGGGWRELDTACTIGLSRRPEQSYLNLMLNISIGPMKSTFTIFPKDRACDAVTISNNGIQAFCFCCIARGSNCSRQIIPNPPHFSRAARSTPCSRALWRNSSFSVTEGMASTHPLISLAKFIQYAPRTPVQDAFFAIFATQSAADNLLSHSPLRYKLVSSPQSGGSAETAEGTQPTESIFQLDASKTSFNHELFLHSSVTNPLHGPFIPDRDSPLSRSLEFSLPTSITSAGMADWSLRYAEDEASEYLQRRAQKADPPRVMKSLKTLKEQTPRNPDE